MNTEIMKNLEGMLEVLGKYIVEMTDYKVEEKPYSEHGVPTLQIVVSHQGNELASITPYVYLAPVDGVCGHLECQFNPQLLVEAKPSTQFKRNLDNDDEFLGLNEFCAALMAGLNRSAEYWQKNAA